MVEDHIDSENNPPVKRRSRLFGGRKARKEAESLAAAEEQLRADRLADSQRDERRPTPALPAETSAAASGPASSTATNVKVSVSENESNEPWLEPDLNQAPAAPPATTPRPTTSLLFQAPDIQPLPPRAPQYRGDDDDFDDSDDDRDDRGDDRSNRSADTTVRRRTRRRSGDESRLPDDLPPNTVVKVRPPRQAQAPELITEPQRIKGSTRLEAKKQRRRDGRDAGRRRPVITEAEFLARREAVDRSMVVRSSQDRIQIGVLEDGVLVEHYVAKSAEASLIGNVYLGRVQNVLPSMEAAFVDIGRGRNAVLYSGEVDWDAADTGNQPRRIELALKPGDTVLVQVTKDPVGHKGARLTSQVSLPGRYLVYVPNGNMNGISRKLPDTERARLKKILKEVLPENVGVIVRTAAEGATEEQLTLDVNRLISQWAAISDNVKALQAPALLHSEPDLLIKIIRDVFNEDFHKLVISGSDARLTIETYLSQVAPDLVDRIEIFEGTNDPFDQFRISEQIEKALDRKVWLPSGGSLVIDRTEAMTVVDVNTGKFVGSGGNLEETVTKNNLEAADEIVRQLRLRDIGGIIVVDFIDMVLETNRDLVLRRLVECLSRDRTKHQVAEVTSLGLVQMTRKKLGLGLLESFSEPCEVCAGRGVIINHDAAKHKGQTPQPERRTRSKGGSQNSNGNGSNNNGSNGSQNGGSNGNGSGSSNGSHSNGVTHSITPAAQSALAKIAASTIAGANVTKADQSSAAAATAAASSPEAQEALAGLVAAIEETIAASPESEQSAGAVVTAPAASGSGAGSASLGEADADEGPRAEPSQRSRRNSRRSRSQRAAANAEARAEASGGRSDAGDGAAEAQAEAPVDAEGPLTTEATERASEGMPVSANEAATAESPRVDLPILDIPVSAPVVQNRKREDADKLLGSVLDALPEPKQPGQGRSRNRRVSTAALSAPVEKP
ncbi:Rne/Rng family ribonuclease [Subtercola sp. PAMC28395]|uniref:Rne/Rng family ribonuclease n=1 Tax=Subtercola sp. PAMC28395 TaxID=2846775 RepID=UPI001C0CF3F4|nr:Rne/Rng family ribonuclease [Subtercola sp. PAMC28395]QWT22943.1 Rne/Rng family ribonuclease [Subtercola sp. PAMC28395]